MDKKLLESFNNLSLALEQLADALEQNRKNDSSKSNVAEALKKLNIGDQIRSIDVGIKKLHKDTQQIISEQKKLSSIVNDINKNKSNEPKVIKTNQDIVKNKEENTTIFGKISDSNQKKAITDGVKIVLLIAAGVLAVGMAFKLIGVVDLKSVIAISLSLPLLAIAFQKISNIKIDIKQLSINNLGLIMMATSIVAISYILSAVKVVGKDKLLTSLEIAAGFVLLSYSISRISNVISGIKTSDLWKLPIVMITSSIALSASSWILQYINPVSPTKMATAVFIGLSFILLSSSISKISLNISSINTRDLWKLPIVLIAASAAIAGSSWILQWVRPVGISQMITSILIAGSFVLLSPVISKMAESIGKISVKDLWKLPIVLVAASAAISASSWLLQWVKPVGVNQMITTILIAGAFTILSINIGKLASSISKVDVKDLWKLPIVLVAASAAISASSWILQWVRPVGISQMITTILISAAFVVLSFGIGRLARSMRGVDLTGVAIMPIVLIGVSLSIAISSQFLSKVVPITWQQALTTIFIGVTFTILSFGLSRIAESVKRVGVGAALTMPIILVALSAAIMGSSYLLANVQPISVTTLINIALQAVALSLIGITLGLTISVLSKIGLGSGASMIKNVAFGSISLLMLAGTISLSSLILSIGSYKNYPSLAWTIGVGISMLAFGVTTSILGTLIFASGGLGLGALALGAFGMLIIAGTITSVASILNTGSYGKYPSIPWSVGVGLSMGTFGLAITGLGLLIGGTLGVGYLLLKAGASAMKMIASTIVDTSFILSEGKYTGGPGIGYAIGTGLLLSTFGSTMLLVGGFIGGTLGLGYLALKAGSDAIKLVSQSIVDSSFILASGRYSGGPTKQWAEGVSLAISAFAPVYKSLMNKGIIGIIFGGGGSSPEKMKKAIIAISQGIVTAAQYFNSNVVAFKNGPPVEWAEGVGKAISSFAPVYASLTNKGIIGAIFGGGGSSPEKMKQAIITISQGIITAAEFFAQKPVVFRNGVPVDWAEGVGRAIESFAPVFKNLSSGGIFSLFTGSTTGDDMKNAIIAISKGIIEAAILFDNSRARFSSSYPRKEWSEGVGNAIIAFGPAFEWANNNKTIFGAETSFLKRTLTTVATAILETSIILSKGIYSNTIKSDYLNTLSLTYKYFFDIINKADDMDSDKIESGTNKMIMLSTSIANISKRLSSGSYNIPIPNNYSNLLYSIFSSFFKISDETRNKYSDIGKLTFLESIASSISNISKRISSGSYNIPINNNYPLLLSDLFDLFLNLSKSSKVSDISGISTLSEISNSIVDISKKISGGSYNIPINNSYTNLLSNLYDTFIKTSRGLSQVDMNSLLNLENISDSIVSISNRISKGNYNLQTNVNYSNSIKSIFESFVDIVSRYSQYTTNYIQSGISSISTMADGIVSINSKLSLIDPKLKINSDYSSNLSSIFESFSSMISKTNIDDSILSKINILELMSLSISNISKHISGGIYNVPLTTEYTTSLSNIYDSFFNIASKYLNIIDNISPRSVNLMSLIADSIKSSSIALSQGNYTSSIPFDWMQNLSSNIISYMKMINYLKGTSNVEQNLFGFAVSRSSEISRMADDYDKLANSVKNLSTSIEQINIEKISALKTLTGSVVLMSLMDSNQFESMMDALEKRTNGFVNIINDVKSQGVSGLSINTKAEKQSSPDMQEVVSVLNRMDARLGQIATTNNNISSYVNQLRSSGSGANLKRK